MCPAGPDWTNVGLGDGDPEAEILSLGNQLDELEQSLRLAREIIINRDAEIKRLRGQLNQARDWINALQKEADKARSDADWSAGSQMGS